MLQDKLDHVSDMIQDFQDYYMKEYGIDFVDQFTNWLKGDRISYQKKKRLRIAPPDDATEFSSANSNVVSLPYYTVEDIFRYCLLLSVPLYRLFEVVDNKLVPTFKNNDSPLRKWYVSKDEFAAYYATTSEAKIRCSKNISNAFLLHNVDGMKHPFDWLQRDKSCEFIIKVGRDYAAYYRMDHAEYPNLLTEEESPVEIAVVFTHFNEDGNGVPIGTINYN